MIVQNRPSKKSLFLTGATGLLGRYLMRDLSLADVPLAVLVRSNRRASAQERVDAIMSFWENELGRTLPRPVVLEGDLSEPTLGLNDKQAAWVKRHCRGAIHNAASLSFVSTGRDSEPYRSNSDGTRHLLDFCQANKLQDFHHVSTAYVCGLRKGVIRETELDEGQEFGNPYEESKAEAELMVRNAEFLKSVTCYRPGIIVGDSQTGFTNTFHGFYAAVQLVHTLAQHGNGGLHSDLESGHVCHSRVRLNLRGDENKNLVCVDWVSAVMAHIITHPEHHEKTYHLTPRIPADLRIINQAMQTATKIYGTRFVGADNPITNPNEIEEFFYQHFKIYNSYWRNDPKFDSTNTQQAAPHLPCPQLNYQSLVFLARKAIDMGFVWRDKPPAADESDSAYRVVQNA